MYLFLLLVRLMAYLETYSCYPTIDMYIVPIACLYATYIPLIVYLYTTSILLIYD